MLSLTSAELTTLLATYLWPLVRILALLGAAPLLGNASVPARVKIGLALLLAFIVAPTLPAPPHIDPGSAVGMLILLQQVLIGLMMAMVMRIVFASVEAAGEIIGLQMGLGFATFYDPQTAGQSPLIGQFLGLIATLLFLAMNGHLLMLAVLVESFQVLPIRADPLAAVNMKTLAMAGGGILSTGLWLSLPLVAALLMTNIALAVLSRSAPQLNIFAIGFPITLSVGFLVLAWSLPYLATPIEKLMTEGLQMMLAVIQPARS